MSVSLNKARAAIEALRLIDIDNAEPDANGLVPVQLVEQWNRLIAIARLQAVLSQAESLERIATALEKSETPR